MKVLVRNRVPHIIFLYWVIKIASTTLGETGADMVSMTFNLGYGSTIIIFSILFLVLLGLKLALKRYDPTLYWLVFTSTAIAGTAISDFIDRTLGFGYIVGSMILMVMLLTTLYIWYKKEKTINVEWITTPTAETLYWIAFLIANTLGTAMGDMIADDCGIGFFYSAAALSGVLGILGLLHYYTKTSGVLIFWLAFVLTRPFGATFGDLLTKPIECGGLDLGTIGSSVFFAVLLFFAIRKESKLEKMRLK